MWKGVGGGGVVYASLTVYCSCHILVRVALALKFFVECVKMATFRRATSHTSVSSETLTRGTITFH